MKLIWKGSFDGDIDSLPKGGHRPGAVAFKEAEDTKELAKVANIVSVVIILVLMVIYFLRCRKNLSFVGILLSLLTLVPHELLHAVCFRETVYMYSNLKQGMMFVLGPETMSRARFVIMSLLPNIVFGVVPYVLFLIRPEWRLLGSMGAFCISMGVGDYYNVYNAMTQMPKGARTYLHGFHSWWYMPEKQ